MAYQINKTDGSVLATVADGQIDRVSSDISLIGKNFSGFGESLNENFIKLLENFANNVRPENPIRGQLWFDTSDLKLKIYSGNGFIPVGSASISRQQPSLLNPGDLWYNEADQQLFFFNGNSLILLAPGYTQGQGKSGLEVVTIADTINRPRTVVYMYVSGILLGIFSKDTFTPRDIIPGFSGNILPGFNSAPIAGLKINAIAADSEKLGGIPSESYIKNVQGNEVSLIESLSVGSNQGIKLGSNSQFSLTIDNSGSINLSVKNPIQYETAISVSPSLRQINFYPSLDTQSSQIIVGGNLTVKGNFTVEGTQTIITLSEQNILIEDKNIILAQPIEDDPSDSYADGGGLILKGDTDKEFLWTNNTWNSSENINISEYRHFAIANVPVIEQISDSPPRFRLTSAVTETPGVTTIGIQDRVEIGSTNPESITMRLQGNTISCPVNTLNLVLSPSSGRNIELQNSPRITGLSNPVNINDATNKNYVDNTVRSRTLVFSIDLSDNRTDSYIINNILNQLAPVNEFLEGTLARVLCSIAENNPVTVNLNPLIVRSQDLFNRPTGTALALTNISIDTPTIQGATIKVTRFIKVFRITNSVWAFQESITLPL